MLTNDQTLTVRVAIVGEDGLIESITNVEPIVLSDLPPNRVENVPEHVDDLTHRWDDGAKTWQLLPLRPNAPHYWKGGGWKVYPPQPHPSAEFDYDTEIWVDPRSTDEKTAEAAAAKAAARQRAALDKSELLMRMALPEIAILSGEDAIDAAQGRIPASFEAALASLPVEAQMMARIKWAGDQVISRMNPLLLLAAYARGISDEQMDAVFGIT